MYFFFALLVFALLAYLFFAKSELRSWDLGSRNWMNSELWQIRGSLFSSSLQYSSRAFSLSTDLLGLHFCMFFCTLAAANAFLKLKLCLNLHCFKEQLVEYLPLNLGIILPDLLKGFEEGNFFLSCLYRNKQADVILLIWSKHICSIKETGHCFQMKWRRLTCSVLKSSSDL